MALFPSIFSLSIFVRCRSLPHTAIVSIATPLGCVTIRAPPSKAPFYDLCEIDKLHLLCVLHLYCICAMDAPLSRVRLPACATCVCAGRSMSRVFFIFFLNWISIYVAVSARIPSVLASTVFQFISLRWQLSSDIERSASAKNAFKQYRWTMQQIQYVQMWCVRTQKAGRKRPSARFWTWQIIFLNGAKQVIIPSLESACVHFKRNQLNFGSLSSSRQHRITTINNSSNRWGERNRSKHIMYDGALGLGWERERERERILIWNENQSDAS